MISPPRSNLLSVGRADPAASAAFVSQTSLDYSVFDTPLYEVPF